MEIVTTHSAMFGIAVICSAIGMARACFYRWLHPRQGAAMPRVSPRALSISEREAVLGVLHEDRFVDQAPAEVYATLLDEERYLCSERTMYRVLEANAEVRERRDQLRHPAYAAPELLATRPNELWSWDITKLHGPETWTYFYLYVILDVFSRYVVGWMIAPCESGPLAEQLIRETCERQGIERDKLTLHADRGSSMKSKLVAMLLSDLGVTKTHSRPHVSNDNPYSESLFKTLKYRPEFPERFGSIEDSRGTCGPFFDWYNTEHHHGGIAHVTPEDMHYGRAAARVAARSATLLVAHLAHPERFVNGVPVASPLPTAAWINKPMTASQNGTSALGYDAPSIVPEHVRAKRAADAPGTPRQNVDADRPGLPAIVSGAVPLGTPDALPAASASRVTTPDRSIANTSSVNPRAPVAPAPAGSGFACSPPASAADAPASDAHAHTAPDSQTQGDLIPLHPLTVPPRRDSRRITPRQNLATDSASEVTRH